MRVKYLDMKDVTMSTIYHILEIDDTNNFSTVVTYDTETTVGNSPIGLHQKIELSAGNVIVVDSVLDNYSFVNAWSCAITNDNKLFYSILGRTKKELGKLFQLFRDATREKLSNHLLNLIDNEKDSKAKRSLKNKLKKVKDKQEVRNMGVLRIYAHNFTYDWYHTKDSILSALDTYKVNDKCGSRSKVMTIRIGYPNTDYTNKDGKQRHHRGFANIHLYDSLQYFDCALARIETEIFQKTKDWDYNKFRTYLTELTEEEKIYVQHDTLKLAEALHNLREEYGHVEDIPMTKTGIVRQANKGICKHSSFSKEWNEKQRELFLADEEELKIRYSKNFDEDKNGKKKKFINKIKFFRKYDQLLRYAFHGGISQGNFYLFNKILLDVGSDDVASMYPFMIRMMQFVYRYETLLSDNDIKKILKSSYDFTDYLNHKVNWGWIGVIRFKHIKAKDWHGVLDLSESDVLNSVDYCEKYLMNELNELNLKSYDKSVYNGKIYEGSNIVLCLTDLDFMRLQLGYTFEKPEILYGYKGKYEDPPKSLMHLLDKFALDKIYYKDELKENNKKYGEGSEQSKISANRLSFSKKNFNSCYGFLVQNEVREILTGVAEEYNITTTEALNHPEFEKKYNQYLKSVYTGTHKTNTTYEMGLQTTAYSRLYFVTMSKMIHDNGGTDCYGDTDSHKSQLENRKFIDEYNDKIKEIVFRIKPELKDIWTEKKCLGVWEYEGMYPHFIHYGSKRYIHTNYTDSGEVETIYTYWNGDNIIRRDDKMFDELEEYSKNINKKCTSIESMENSENFLTKKQASKLAKHFGLKLKIVEKLSVTFAGLDKDVVEFYLYQNYDNTYDRMNNLFSSLDNETQSYKLVIDAEFSNKLTHTIVDLKKCRYEGKVYDVLEYWVDDNEFDVESCCVLTKQEYSSSLSPIIDQIYRIQHQDSSLQKHV